MHEPVPHAMHVDLEKTEGPDHEPDESHMMPEHVAAPVSRAAQFAGEPEPMNAKIDQVSTIECT